MFSFSKQIDQEPLLKLFCLTLHVGRGSNADMPANLVGAYVPVFVGAMDHESAASLAVSSLRKQGFEFLDIADGKIRELDPMRWDTFVKEAWSDFADHFPSQQTVIDRLASEFFFTGPFASYEAR